MNKTDLKVSRTALIAVAFIGFTVTVAVRDLMFRFAFMHGTSFSAMALLTGLASLIAGLLVLGRSRAAYQIKRPRLLLARFALNLGSGYLVLKAFELLPASFINITTKSALPILIVASPILGLSYGRREKALAVAALLSIAMFAGLHVHQGITWKAILVLTTSIFVTLAEFLFVSKSVRDEHPHFLSLVPSVALTVVGAVGLWQTSSFVPPSSMPLGLAAGVMFFLAYYTSVVRYRVLPPGLAEYPSLLTYFVVLPASIWLLGERFEPTVFANALLVLSIMTTLLTLHRRNSRA